MKTYIVLRSFAGLKEGEILHNDYQDSDTGLWFSFTPVDRTVLLALGFIEETGKIAQEVGGEKKVEIICPNIKAFGRCAMKGCSYCDKHHFSPPPQNEWRPKEDSDYWYIAGEFKVFSDRYFAFSWMAKTNYKLGNCFKTESAALRAAEEIRNLLKKLPKE